MDSPRQPLLSCPGVVAQVNAFCYRGSQLFCEDVPLAAIAERAGTPCYVYSREAIVGNFQNFESAFCKIQPRICYAVKANSNLSILRTLKELGSGFDIVSAGELYRLQSIGVDAESILFSGVGKTTGELKAALALPLLCINVESLPELGAIAALSARSGARPRLSLRINPDVDVPTHPYISTGVGQHKFGVTLSQIDVLTEQLAKNRQIDLVAVGCHIGSQILKIEPFLEAFARVKEVADDLRSKGFPIRFLNLGGGIGIPYQGESPPDLSRYARFLAEKRCDYSILFEPGRFIVGNAGILLTQVLYQKAGRGKRFTIVDGAMNDFLRPSLYQAYHEILSVSGQRGAIQADLVGPICESGDFFALDRSLPEVQPGEYLALMNAGAYGFALASNYNSRPRAAEVLVSGKSLQIIRRRETLKDLIRGEV